MKAISAISKLKERELKEGVNINNSWHQQYSSAYIFIGGLPYGMNEGDIVIVFSQFGEVVDVHLIRDRQSGKSKGFGFLAFEDQRSTILAVDNLNGVEVCGKTIRVDHVQQYRPPKQFLSIKEEINQPQYRPTGPDGKGWGKFRRETETIPKTSN